jgi:hypothetical protein
MMHKYQVITPADALAYITDCTLATVGDMAGKKSRPKHEFERQMAIAQTAITWMQEMGVDVSTTRAEDVVAAGSVQKWAEKYMPNAAMSGAEPALSAERPLDGRVMQHDKGE